MKLLFSTLLLFPLSLLADQLEQSRIELEAKKKVYISKSLDLNENESQNFWDLYSDYEKELGQQQKNLFDLIREFNKGYNNKSISNPQVGELLEKYFEIEESKVAIKKSYLPKFQDILPNKKVMRFYQIDNKVDSLIRCDIAKQTPLIEPDMEF